MKLRQVTPTLQASLNVGIAQHPDARVEGIVAQVKAGTGPLVFRDELGPDGGGGGGFGANHLLWEHAGPEAELANDIVWTQSDEVQDR